MQNEQQEAQDPCTYPSKCIALKRIKIGECGNLSPKKGLDRLLDQCGQDQSKDIPVRSPLQDRNHRQDEKADNEEENGVPDKMIAGIAKYLAERHAKRRPDLTQPVEREPEEREGKQDKPEVAQAQKRDER